MYFKSYFITSKILKEGKITLLDRLDTSFSDCLLYNLFTSLVD